MRDAAGALPFVPSRLTRVVRVCAGDGIAAATQIANTMKTVFHEPIFLALPPRPRLDIELEVSVLRRGRSMDIPPCHVAQTRQTALVCSHGTPGAETRRSCFAPRSFQDTAWKEGWKLSPDTHLKISRRQPLICQ